MSGSIHETRRSVHAVEDGDHAQAEAHDRAHWFAHDQLDRKRRIKRATHEARSTEVGADVLGELAPVAAADLPISANATGEFFVHPLGPDDIRGLLARLPLGVLDGLARIELRAGDGTQGVEDDYPEPDPLSGRRGVEALPGMWWQQLQGIYHRKGALIEIYSVVADVTALPFPAEEMQLARLHVADTVLHELAHHLDATRRVARGRWRMDDRWNIESFAVAQATRWVIEVAVPFLEERFPADNEALVTWLRKRCHTDITMAQIATALDVQFGGYFNALQQSFVDAGEGKDDQEVAVQFARELHYNEHYAEALHVLAEVRAIDDGNLDAQVMQADIAEHERRYEEAESLALTVLQEDASNSDALHVLRDVYDATRRYQDVVSVMLREFPDGSTGMPATARATLGRAYLELGDMTALDSQLEVMEGTTYRSGRSDARILRAMRALRGGDAAAALRMLGPEGTSNRPIARLIRWEAAQRLGRADAAGTIEPWLLDVFRANEGEWVGRLEAEFGPIQTGTTATLESARWNRGNLKRL